MNIGILANSSLAIPTLHSLLSQRKLKAVAVPYEGNEYTEQVVMMSIQSGIMPVHLSKENLQAELKNWININKLDLVLVFTFPWLIHEQCLRLPQHGFYNVHFAPLPAYRGAAPIFWLIKNRETTGGFCIHRMTAKFDEGPIVYQRDFPLGSEDSLGMHMGQLSVEAIEWTSEFLDLLEKDNLSLREQDSQKAKEWPNPEVKDLIIDWATHTAEEIKAIVQASNPYYGGAITHYQQSPLRIFDVTIITGSDLPAGIRPGTILNASTGAGLFVACKDSGVLRVDVIKLEEGYFSGDKLFEMGVQAGTFFSTPN